MYRRDQDFQGHGKFITSTTNEIAIEIQWGAPGCVGTRKLHYNIINVDENICYLIQHLIVNPGR